jgi:hypothetical protein
MEKKISKVFVDEGFGFPVRLVNVPMVKVRGQWTPNINYNELAKVVLIALAHKPARITGHEVRFIRQHFEMSLQTFAERFCVSHPAVIKWERAGKNATAMAWTTEKDLRLFVLSRLGARPNDLVELYARLEQAAPDKIVPVEIDAKKVAA